MAKMVSEFDEAYRNRHQLAQQMKKAGKKIFGYFFSSPRRSWFMLPM